MIFATYLGELFAFIPFMIVIFMVFIAYSILKFAGVLFLACGFIGPLYVSMTIFYVGAVASDVCKMTYLSPLNGEITSNIQGIAWSTKNYKVYLKVTNSDKILKKYFLQGRPF
jgi:hypothetical protein